jgi:hypothetical protein
MITLPANYSAINDKKAASPAVIVSIEESELKTTKTTETDWGNNSSESDVDYASVSGSTILQGGRNKAGWNERTNSFSTGINSIFYNGSNLWVATASGEIASSTDGITWTQRTTGISSEITNVVHDLSGLWAIVASAGEIETSTDGITWTSRTSSFGSTAINGITYGGGLFIAVGGSGKLASSTDGITWTQRTSQFGSTDINDVYYDNSIYVAVGDSGKISTSTDGTTWTSRTSGISENLWGVSYGNGLWVAVGTTGKVITASDPTGTWTSRTSGTSNTIVGIRYDNLTEWWVFTGGNGILSTSEDAITWTSRSSDHDHGSNQIQGIYSGDNQFIIVGDGPKLSTGYFYAKSGDITTNNIDLGSTPTVDGEWQLGDIVPTGTTLTYEAWSSVTGVFDIWSELSSSNTPTPRTKFGYCIDGDDFYIFGGYDGTTELNELWKCDLSSKYRPWTQLTSGATARQTMSLVVNSGKLYVFGGYNGTVNLNDIYEYTISGDSWALKSPSGTPPSIRQGHIAIVDSNKMYIHGGIGAAHLKDLHVYDITGNSWSALTSSSVERYSHVAVISSGKIYIYAGWNTGSGALNTVEEYTISGDSWASKTAGGTAANLRAAVLYSGSMYVFGGNTGSPINSTFAYNISGDSWATVDSGSTARSGHGGVLYNGKMYIFGGYDGSDELNDLWSYGTLGGDAISIGTIEDGDAIIDLKRYYSVRATLTANTGADKTPILQGITASFVTFKKLTETKGFGYNVSITGISSLTTKIDFFKESTIGQVGIDTAFTQELSTYFSTQRKNRLVRIQQGFKDLAEADFINYYYGVISDVDIDTGEQLSISVDDYTVTWSKPVPEKWESSADDVTWTNQHPIDVMLDIFQNHLDVRDSFLLYSTFDTVKAAIPSWIVSRTITGRSEDSKKLIEELRQLMSCFFIPQPDGKISIKRYDSTEAAVATITDDDFIIAPSLSFSGNYDDLINHQLIYYGWDGAGNDLADFSALEDYTNSTSVTNNKEEKFKTTKDKWTLSGQSTQVVDRRTKVDGVFGDAPVILSGKISRRLIALEVGDMVNITIRRYPKSGGFGITAKKFLLTERNYNYQDSNIGVKFLEV